MAKILNVFYGADNLPYKDKDRSVHFPIVGSAFQGASDTTEIHFYFDRIGEPNTSWVAVSKLPNGKIGSKVLQVEEDTTLEEEYALLKLSSFYTQYKGDLFISLQGYNGEVQVEYDESSELYTIKGTPTIQATGSIKLAINYATQFVGSGEESNADLQSMLSLLGTKLNIGSGIVVLTDLANTDLSSYSNGQLIYDKATDAYYIKTNSSPYYQLADTNGLLGNKGALARYEVNGTSEVRQLYTIIGDRLVCLKTNNHDYLVQMSSNSVILVYDVIAGYIYFYASANESAITLNQVISDTYKQIIATKEDLENFGNLFTYKGAASVSEINALTDIGNGWAYNLTDSGTLTQGNVKVNEGDNVAFDGTVWTKLSSETVLGQYYTKQQGQTFESEIDNRVSSVEDEIESISSGAPSGTYATVSDLTTAGPDHSKVYLVLADGKWYYYNTSTSSWTAGGTYLSTGNAVPTSRKIADIDLADDIGRQELVNNIADDVLISGSSHALMNKAVSSLFDIDYGENLLDQTAVTNGYYVNPNTGGLHQNASYFASDYIPVSEGQSIRLQRSNSLVNMSFLAAYDEFKNFVSGSSGVSTYVVPSGVKYIRFSNDKTYLSLYMIIVGTIAKCNPIPYHVPYYTLKNANMKPKLTSILGCFDEYRCPNLLNKNDITIGYKAKDGSGTGNEGYWFTNRIEVSEGQTVTAFIYGDGRKSSRFVCCYDENLTLMESSGSNDYLTEFVVPAGVKYIYMTFDSLNPATNMIIYVGAVAPDHYIEYYPPYYVLKKQALKKEDIKSIIDELTLSLSTNDLSFAEWQNYFDKDTALVGYYIHNNTIVSNPDYFASDYIEVEPNTTYSLASHNAMMRARFLDEYNENKQVVQAHGEESTFTTSSTTKYVRVTFYARKVSGVLQNLSIACMVKGEYPVVGLQHIKLIPDSYIMKKTKVQAFLPKNIYCAVEQTIEIYNDQVLPCADHYHFQWNCTVGKALNRKFSITGTAGLVGEYTLRLNIYDDDENIVGGGVSTLKIVSALGTQKSICPIGDSLTNSKYWLKYVNETLSNGNIYYVGTRGSVNGQKHEGRSGWSTTRYLSDTDYSYEQPTTPNPFWDDTLERFSWDYYKTTYGINPDCVQIWLGTNDLLGITATQFVTNIKQMVSYIRQDDASIPIFICLTILPAEQNGIGVQQSVDGFASNAGYWQYHWWNTIIQGVKLLEEELLALSDSNLHIIPLVCSHDSKYNFGVVETNVNPHITTVKEPMPVEGVHPQQAGYEQIGDILYSCYCAKLGS